MNTLLVILIGIASSYILTTIFRQFKMPRVLAPILVGVVLGHPYIYARVFTDYVAESIFSALSDIGLVFLLFYVGLEINVREIKKTSRQTILVALLGVIIPFLLGFVATVLLGYSATTAFIVGAAFAVSAEAIAIVMLDELRMRRSRIGRIIIEAGVLDDIIEITVIAGLSAIIISSEVQQSVTFTLLRDFGLFFAFLLILRYIFIPLTSHFINTDRSDEKYDMFTATMILVLSWPSSLITWSSVLPWAQSSRELRSSTRLS